MFFDIPEELLDEVFDMQAGTACPGSPRGMGSRSASDAASILPFPHLRVSPDDMAYVGAAGMKLNLPPVRSTLGLSASHAKLCSVADDGWEQQGEQQQPSPRCRLASYSSQVSGKLGGSFEDGLAADAVAVMHLRVDATSPVQVAAGSGVREPAGAELAQAPVAAWPASAGRSRLQRASSQESLIKSGAQELSAPVSPR